MILLPHLLLGALIGEKVSNPAMAVILAILSHYLLDLLPHNEYSIENIRKKQWRQVFPDALNIGIDFFSGVLLILIFSKNHPIIYVCAFFAIMPDGLTILNKFFPNQILEKHRWFHTEKIHFLKYKKIPKFWRFFTQIVTVLVCVLFLSH